MSREEEFIREALKVNISATDEVNNRILRTVEQKRYNNFMRIVAVAVLCCIVFSGTVIVVDAATGGRIVEYLKGKIDNETYVYENGSNTNQEIVQINGEEWEQVKYIEENVIMSHPISPDETEYNMYLKVTDIYGNNNFINLLASVKDGETTEDLYYAIRGDFLWRITKFQNSNEKEQILTGLKEAAENTDSMAVRDALLDLSSDYEENRRIFYIDMPGKWWGEDDDIVIFEDISNLPSGKIAIIVDTVDDKEKSWIFTLQIDDNTFFVNQYCSGSVYQEEYQQELIEKEIPIYDLR